MNYEFPVGLDYAWLACDAKGNVGRFTNAGLGPIPLVVIAARYQTDQVEPLIRGIPIVESYDLRIQVPNPSDFIETARRGLHVYDWFDICRKDNFQNCYEIACRPIRPIKFEELSTPLQEIAALVTLKKIVFEDCDQVAIEMHEESVR